MKRCFLIGGLSLGLACLGLASPGSAASPRNLLGPIIAPDSVLAHGDEIGLTVVQRQAVQQIQAELQPKLAPLLQQMREERDALVTALQQAKPDEGKVLARFEKLNAAESEMKRLRLRMSVRTQALLTAEQLTKVLALAPRSRGAAGATGDATAETGQLPAKLQRFKQGIEQWKREGRDVTKLRELWERFQEAEAKGYFRQARQALDEAISLLDAPAPSP